MGKPTGFLEYPASCRKRAAAAGASPTGRSSTKHGRRIAPCASRAPAAWTAASLSATPAPLLDGMASGLPHQTTSSRGTTWSTAACGAKRSNALTTTDAITFPEFPGASLPRPQCEGSLRPGHQRAGSSPNQEHRGPPSSIGDSRKFGSHPEPPARRTGAQGGSSAPAGGLAARAAQQGRPTGSPVSSAPNATSALLMYGSPQHELDKRLVERRRPADGGRGVPLRDSAARSGKDFAPSRGAPGIPRHRPVAAAPPRRADLPVEGRTLLAFHLAMDFLHANTKSLLDKRPPGRFQYISAKDRDVIVIGAATRHRLRRHRDAPRLAEPLAISRSCRSRAVRAPDNPWPQWPKIYRLDYGQERRWRAFGCDAGANTA